jgi:hypothetical protein
VMPSPGMEPEIAVVRGERLPATKRSEQCWFDRKWSKLTSNIHLAIKIWITMKNMKVFFTNSVRYINVLRNFTVHNITRHSSDRIPLDIRVFNFIVWIGLRNWNVK